MTLSASFVVCGIDVSKDRLDVALGGMRTEKWQVPNTPQGQTMLAKDLAKKGVSLVVMEATGGYEAAGACTLQALELATAVINPR